MSPVITFTLGRCVASTMWIPVARAFCASIASGFSTSPCTVIIRSASSSTKRTMYGSGPSVYGTVAVGRWPLAVLGLLPSHG